MQKFSPYLKYILLAALIYMPVFGHLDSLVIRMWDESRLAQNTWEMEQNGNLLVTYCYGQPDLWNTKPPLMIWMQLAFVKLIGFNELAIRLPSAIATFFTCLLLLLFTGKYLRRSLHPRWFAFVTVLVLVCMDGYICLHGTRTGDYDALLTLFTTASTLFFFAFMESGKRNYLYLFFLCLSLAILTKGIAGLLMTPALLIYVLLRGQIACLLRDKHFYYGLTVFLIITAGYYLLREFLSPGYLQAVWENELGGRYLEPNEEHTGGFWYYYNNFTEYSMRIWYLPLLCGFFLGITSADQRVRRLSQFSGLVIITYFLVISLAKTKLPWYDLPMYPFMAILVAVLIHYIFSLLAAFTLTAANAGLKPKVLTMLPYLFLLIVFITPYTFIWRKTYLPEQRKRDMEEFNTAYFLKDAANGKHEINNNFIVLKGLSIQVRFYINMLQHKGIHVDFKDWEKLEENDRIICGQREMQDYIRTHYETSETEMGNKIILFDIRHRRS
jgi:4-amino-4-deoxy-L-arabinose transferase-like glycosyltransferase